MSTPAASVDRAAGASGWRLATIAFGTAVAVLLVSQWRTVASLLHAWGNDGTYQYAFLIFPISAWLAFDLRDRLRTHSPVPSAWGVAAVAMLLAIAGVGRALSVNLPQHFALVALFPALLLACWGWRAVRTLWFPLAYLVAFAVPWGDGMVGPLQDITAHIAVAVLNLTGFNVLLNGREIMTPSTVWMVADACSGVRFFFACMALGCLYAWLLYQRTRKRVLFVLASAIVPVIANGLRVYFTVVIGETWGLHYATGTDHLVFGWQFFGTVLILLLLAGWFFRDPVAKRIAAPVDAQQPPRLRMLAWPAVIVLLLASAVLAAPAGNVAASRAYGIAAPIVAGWAAPVDGTRAWQPYFAGADAQFAVTYAARDGSVPVGLFHAVYTGAPRRGHDLVTYGNDVFDPATTHILAATRGDVRLAEGRHTTARELRVTDDGGARLIWYWYCVDDRCTASPVWTKLMQAWVLLRGRPLRSSVWALAVPVSTSDSAAGRKVLQAFASRLSITMPAQGATR